MMSPPPAEEQDEALAAIAGTPLGASVTRLALIGHARRNGASWNVIGAILGVPGRQAKAETKRLARDARREAFGTQARHQAEAAAGRALRPAGEDGTEISPFVRVTSEPRPAPRRRAQR